MFKIGENYREVYFIENICPFYNVEILKKLHPSIPTHKYGWVDFISSNISNSLGLKNIILDNTSISHMRSGVRKKMNSINSSFDEYNKTADYEWIKWIEKNDYLKKYTNKNYGFTV